MTGGEPRSPRWEIGEVLVRTDLTHLLDELAVPATRSVRGRRWHCPTPDHDDRHPSVTVHTDHRGHERWRCWSGDHTHRGDAIDLVIVTQQLPRTEAIDWLARRAGMIPNEPLPPVRPKPRPPAPRFVPLDPVVARYAEACERILWTHTGAPVRDWLHHRGFDDAVLCANRIGADPGRTMMPRRRGLPHGTSPAATLPALDPDGRIHYIQARYLQPDGDKYDNPAGSLGSNPRLAWTRTPDGQSRPGVLLICEGIPDALTASQAGFAAVGILGSLAPDQRIAGQVARYAEQYDYRLVAIPDTDPAGRTWADRLTTLLANEGHALTIIEPSAGSDLNAWAQHNPGWAAEVVPRLAPLANQAASRRDDIHLDTGPPDLCEEW